MQASGHLNSTEAATTCRWDRTLLTLSIKQIKAESWAMPSGPVYSAEHLTIISMILAQQKNEELLMLKPSS